MPRHPTKREIPQKTFLPPRLPGRIADDSGMPAAGASRDKYWVRYAPAANTRNAGAPFQWQLRGPASRAPAAPERHFVARFFSPIVGFVAARLSRRAEQRALWQATDRLSRAPDHLLRDIGITKSEIASRLHIARQDSDRLP